MISGKLKAIIEREFNTGGMELSEKTTANEVPGWDSFSHISVVHQIERDYGIRFHALEIINLKNLGELQSFIDKKIKM